MNQAELIKQQIDLADYVRSCGIELKPHGRNDLKGLCPFHDDKNPSLIITPSKGLFHCPACGAGGSVIDFAAKFHKITVAEAIKKLSGNLRYPSGATGLRSGTTSQTAGRPAKKKIDTGKEVPELSLERQAELLEKAIAFYENTFANVAEGKSYLESRGVTDAGLFSKHRIGYADGSLLKALPSSGEIRKELRSLGLIARNGCERFAGCVVVPIFDEEGRIVTLYGRYIGNSDKKRHLYLPDRPTGLFNSRVMKTYPEIVLVESCIDALSCEMAGINNVVSIQSTNGLNDKNIANFAENGVTKITLMLDGDEAGKRSAHELMKRLSERFSVVSIPLPDGHDPNSYLVKHGPESLQNLFSLAASTYPSDSDGAARQTAGQNGGEAAEKADLSAPASSEAKKPDKDTLVSGLRRYEIIGLEKKQRNLKATIRAEKAGRLHVDTVDFYSSRQRRQLCQDLCNAFEEVPETIDGDISKLLRFCESRNDGKSANFADGGGAVEKKEPALSLAERNEAEKFGRDMNLINRILKDFEKCGLIGEESNKLLTYLAMTSRKTQEPLSVLILSSSGAGKTALQDTALAFCPPEDLVKLTSLSAKALFYKEQTSLKHKVLAIEEGAGAEEASYAIRNLISSDGLTSEVAIRDPQTGKLTTMANTVDGPTSVFCTTTDPEVDPETKSRFLVTGIDESREQTRRILEFQRQRHGLKGLEVNLELEKAVRVHRNFQRLLKPLAVVNPHIDKLSYEDDRLQGRRAQPQYLNIINAVAFLRQMQKEVKEFKSRVASEAKQRHSPPEALRYIEVDEADIELGNKLAVEILGRTLDELSIPARNLLELLEKFIEKKICELRKCDPERLIRKSDITFTRRELREFTGWTQTRLRNHLKELIDLEYVLIDSGMNGRVLQSYKLVYDGQGKDGKPFLPGVKS